ncbi:uncharacterized protein LOC115454261 [Manduca sexta]|uniref:uncharacterized protein LOC115454261 n=1 Tax=Manduca sexta TaxID=7130 RepID=UPI0011823BCD|nr:uncharacterized protein LOC115454261 [Manduca sexta]
MRTAIFLLLVSVISCYAAEEKDTYYYPKAPSEIFLNAAKKCVEDLSYNSSIMDQIMQGKYIEEDKTLNVLICAAVNTGYGNADGKLNVEKVVKELYPERQDVWPIIEKCNLEQVTSTPLETFKGIVVCLKNNLPFKIKFPM